MPSARLDTPSTPVVSNRAPPMVAMPRAREAGDE
jgi:hypothetical protein